MTHDTYIHIHDPDPPAKPRVSNLGRKLQRWTYSEFTRLHQLYAAGKTREEIASDLNMSEERVRSRLQWEQKSGTTLLIRKRRRLAQRFAQKEAQRSPRVHLDLVTVGPKPTAETLRDRNARYLAPPRDLTGAFFGDPPVGFSALERRV